VGEDPEGDEGEGEGAGDDGREAVGGEVMGGLGGGLAAWITDECRDVLEMLERPVMVRMEMDLQLTILRNDRYCRLAPQAQTARSD